MINLGTPKISFPGVLLQFTMRAQGRMSITIVRAMGAATETGQVIMGHPMDIGHCVHPKMGLAGSFRLAHCQTRRTDCSFLLLLVLVMMILVKYEGEPLRRRQHVDMGRCAERRNGG